MDTDAFRKYPDKDTYTLKVSMDVYMDTFSMCYHWCGRL